MTYPNLNKMCKTQEEVGNLICHQISEGLQGDGIDLRKDKRTCLNSNVEDEQV